MKNKYYIYIEPYIEYNVKDNIAFYYNTLDGKELHFNEKLIINLTERLYGNNNSLIIEEEIYIEINNYLNEIKFNFFGDYWLIDENNFHKPYLPVENVNNIIQNIEYNSIWKRKFINMQISEDILCYLHGINIFVNSSSNDNYCTYSYKQVKSNYIGREYIEMSSDIWNKLMKEISNTELKTLTIVGHNLFKFKNIIKPFTDNIKFNYFVSFADFIDNYNNYFNMFSDFLFQNFQINLNIGLYEVKNFDSISKPLEKLVHFTDKIILNFFVENETDIKLVSENSSRISFSYNFIPIINNNIDFFKNHVFNSIEDILEEPISKRIILQRKILNTNFYGYITILPDGSIFSNLNYSAIGNIKDMDLYEAIIKELTNKTSWFSIREKVEPCKNCNYCNLCPPISNYELYLNKFDLCFKSK